MHAAERQAIRLTLWKDLRSAEKVVLGPLKLRFPSSPHPVVKLYAVLVLVSGLLSWKWTVCQRSIPAAIWTTAWLEVYSSIWENSALLGKLGSSSVTWRTWDRTQGATHLAVGCFVRILPDDFSLRRFLANFSVCHELLELFFMISEANTLRQGKVVITKVLRFSDKRRSCRTEFFSILYSWQWPHKGLIKV